ncbi:MAG: AraC family transcriptional regulator [Lachnospiraceae bacterium]
MKKNLQTAFSTRQYMISNDFEIYYYNDTQLKRVNHHTHDYYEFYFFLEGDVSIHINEQAFTLQTGDVILIPPNISHYCTIQNHQIPYRRFIFWISQDYYNQLLKTSSDYGYLVQYVIEKKDYIFHYDPISFNALQSKVFQLLEEVHSQRFGREAKISLCVGDLVLHINRTIYERHHPKSPKEEFRLYQNLITYIETNLENELSLDILAKQFFVSKYYISHVFKENIGLSIHQYIIKKRLAACRDAIISQVPISEAYLQYGFSNYSSFFRSFKKEYGLSPKEYKELYSDVEIHYNSQSK